MADRIASGASGVVPGRAGDHVAGDAPPTHTKGSPQVIAPQAIDRGDWVRQAVARFEKPLVQYAAHILGGDVERARDLAQEVFLRLCDQDPGRVGTHLAEWLYTVCRNLAIDVKRKERRMRLLSDAQAEGYAAEAPPPSAAVERDDAYGAVLRAMGGLPFNQQEVIRLKFQHGLSYKQISEVTKLTVTNVGFLIHTGLKTLRRELAEGGAA